MRAATRNKAEAVLIVFAKAPVPGRVKTRLAPLLGSEGAARLHAELVERAVATAAAAGSVAVELHAAPHARSRYFQGLARRYRVRLRAQTKRGLGERMRDALARALHGAEAAVLIGADCPVLRPADLRRAVRLLHSGADAVFAPTEDGGYALIGLRRISARLFSGIEWGGATVMAETRKRLRRLGWRWRELRTVWDVDRPEDYFRLKRLRLPLPSSAAPRPVPRSDGIPARWDGSHRT